MTKTSQKIKYTIYLTIVSFALLLIYNGGSQLNIIKQNQDQNISSPINTFKRQLKDATEIKIKVCKDTKDASKLSKDDKERGETFRTETRKSYRSENRLKKIITDKNVKFDTKEAIDLLFIILPYLVFLYYLYLDFVAMSAVGVVLIESALRNCKCCADIEGKCCGIQCNKMEPYKGIQLIIPFAGMIICLLFIAIVSIVGLTKAGGLEEGFDTIRCVTIDSLHSLNYEDENWIGINGFAQKLKSLADNVDTNYKQELNNAFGQDTTWIDQSKSSMVTDINRMENNYNVKSGTTPLTNILADPQNESVQYTLSPDGTSTNSHSCFFSTLAPSEDCKDFDNQKKWYVITKAMKKLVNGAIQGTLNATEAVQQAGDNIKQQIDSFSKSIKDGQKQMEDIKKDIDNIIFDYDSNMKDFGDIMEKYFTPILQIIYGVFIAISILLGLIAGLMFAFKSYRLRYFLNICWLFFIFLSYLLFIICSVLLLFSVVGMEFCDFLHLALNDKSEFNSIQSFKGDIKKHITTCKSELGGDGEIINNFNVRDNLNKLNVLDKKMGAFDDEKDKGKQGIKEMKSYFTDTINYLDSLRDTAAINIKKNSVLDSKFIQAHITSLEGDANADACNGAGNTHEWVADSSKCKLDEYIAKHEYIDSDGTQKDMKTNYKKSACIWWNGHPLPATADIPSPLTDTDFQKNRGMVKDGSNLQTSGAISIYNNIGCNNAKTKLVNLMNWRQVKNNLVALKKSQAKTFDNTFQSYETSYNNYNTQLIQFKNATSDMTDKITNKDEGLLADKSTNCKFIGKKIDNFNNAICSVFFPNFYEFTVILICFTFGLFFGSFFMCCTSIRFSKNSTFRHQKNTDEDMDEKNFVPVLAVPVSLNPDGTPVVQQFVNSDGTVRLNPDQTPMIAMVDEQGNPVLNQDGYPIDPSTYQKQKQQLYTEN